MIARALPLVLVVVVEVDVNEELGTKVVCGGAVTVGVLEGEEEDWRWTFCANPTLN
jgi:hypothetical protein